MRAASSLDEAFHIDAELRAIAMQRQQLHAREALLLVRAEELELWRHLGCATFFECLERYCDLHPRTAREYVRVARALRDLPVPSPVPAATRSTLATSRRTIHPPSSPPSPRACAATS